MRDLEAYFFRPDCLAKIWRLGLRKQGDATAILDAVLRAARPLGLLRLVSESDHLDLPFQETELRRRVVATESTVEVDLGSLARALMQNGHEEPLQLDDLLAKVDDVSRQEEP